MKNEKGYILLVTLMALVFIGIIGLSLFTVTLTTHSQSTSERKDQSVFYVAEAGLNIKEARLVKLIDQAYLESKAYEASFEQTFNSKLITILNTEKNSVYDHNIFNSSSSRYLPSLSGPPSWSCGITGSRPSSTIPARILPSH